MAAFNCGYATLGHYIHSSKYIEYTFVVTPFVLSHCASETNNPLDPNLD
jgi:hypothetical protein